MANLPNLHIEKVPSVPEAIIFLLASRVVYNQR